jgi:hypothetical protein
MRLRRLRPESLRARTGPGGPRDRAALDRIERELAPIIGEFLSAMRRGGNPGAMTQGLLRARQFWVILPQEELNDGRRRPGVALFSDGRVEWVVQILNHPYDPTSTPSDPRDIDPDTFAAALMHLLARHQVDGSGAAFPTVQGGRRPAETR